MRKTLLLACLAAALALPASASAAGTYTVRFLPNGGTGTMAAQTFVRDKAGRLSANAFVRTGYVFIGWAKTKTGPVKYKNKKAVKNLAKAGKTAKLYAVWAKKKYKVAFKPNGGTGTMDAEAFAYGKAKRLRANAFKRTGYTFAGWAKTAKGAKAYANKQSVKNLTTKGGTVKLYAVWTGKKATYAFKANGGTGSMATQTFTVGTAQALRANAFKKSGSVFLGWSTSASGPVKYTDRQKFSTPASTGGKTVALYAVWGGDTVLVSGGTNAGENPDSALGSYSLEVSPFRMDRTEVPWGLWKKVRDWGVARGYVFENNGVGKGEDHPVCSVNWYDCLKWCNARSEMEGLEPAYKVNGEVYRTGRRVPGVAEGGPGYRLPTDVEWEYAARGGRVGLRFPWGDTISHAKANYTGGAAAYDTSSGPHGVYATGAYPYTAPVGSFEANGFGLCDMAGNVAEWIWSVVTPGRGVRGGGFDTSDCRCGFANYHEPDKTRESLGFRTVRRPAYSIKFSANGGTGTMAARTGLVPGADVTLPANGFSRENCKFVGWSTSASGDAMWTAGATKKGGFVPRTGTTITLYAVWVHNSYTVRFYANGGSGSMSAQTIPIGEATPLSPNAFSKEDYDFAGWALSQTGPVVFADGDSVTDLSTTDGGTVPLYAVWTRDAYYVSFDPNDATYASGPAAIGAMAGQRMRFGVGTNLDENAFVKFGWVFGGWATNQTGEAVYADGQTVTNLTDSGAITLYATWWGGAVRVASTNVQGKNSYWSCDRSFDMDATEVTIETWTAVREWAITNGYDMAAGAAKGAAHPVHSVSWYDCVKWCNARSEMAGLDPVYTSGTDVYRMGETVPDEDFSKAGYRLPTREEWCIAASGGIARKRFPWGTDSISHALANYAGKSSESDTYDESTGFHPDYETGAKPYTAPVGSFAPTGSSDPTACYLYDMAGNVAEWVDSFDTYGTFKALVCGGGWNSFGKDCCWDPPSDGLRKEEPAANFNDVGFRTVRTVSE